jgi:hypothetical protein
MKKSLIFWFAAITCAAWILVGCESPTDGTAGAAGASGPIGLSGEVPLELVQAAVDSGSPLILAGVQVTGGGVLDLKNANVTVVGAFGTDANPTGGAAYIKAVDANLTFKEGASVKIGGGGDYFIGTQAHVDKAEGTNAGNVGKAVTALANATGGVVGIENLTLASGLVIPSDLKVFVYGTLDVKGTADVPTGGYGNGGISAIGTVLITADNTAAMSVSTNVDVSNATITYGGTSTVAITLPATLSSPTFKVTGNGGVLKVVGTTNVTANVTANNGFVEFAGTVTQATITGGGNVRFKDGTTATGFTTAGSSITASIIEFTNGLSTATSAPLTLSGAVYIPDTKAITFGHADGTLTLTKGSAIYAGTPGGTGTAKVLEATEEALLTPTATAALTAAVSAKKLTLGTAALTLTSGELTVEAGAELALSTDLTVTAANATLVLTGAASTDGAKLTGAGKVVLGNANIIGSDDGWQAVGEGTTITLTATGANAVSITGTGTTPKLVGGTGGVISTGSNSTYSAVTVQLLEIDLTTAGSIVIPYNSTASTIVLKGGAVGKLTLNSAKNTVSVSSTHYANIHKTAETAKLADVAGTGIVVKGSADSNGADAGSIAGGATADDNDATLTGQTATNDVTLDNAATFKDD